MTVQEMIELKLQELQPAYLEVRNESSMHNVPPGSETHFSVTLVSEAFGQRTRVQRHQTINRLLADQLAGPVHALAIHAYTPAEWQSRGNLAPASPDCLGGKAAENQGS